jgi:site-specific DNA-methyltransferase (cytosine-N4-specific)
VTYTGARRSSSASVAGEHPDPTVAERAIIKTGDAFDLLDTLEPESVDLLITSPPYWGHRSYGQEHNWSVLEEWKATGGAPEAAPPYDWYRRAGGVLGLEPFPEWYVAHLAEILDKARSRLKPSASMWINVGDTYFARWASIRENGRQGLGDNARVRRRTPMGDYRQEKQLLLIPARFAIAMQSRRWILRNDLIWFKPNVPPRPESDRLRLSHEHFFHFVLRPKEGRARYHYDISAVEPRAHDVIEVPVRAGQDGHSATFPEDLVRPRILSTCPPKGLVLDPFCGTGRSLAVAIEHGRRAIGFDLSADFTSAARGAATRKRNGSR